MGLKSAQAPGMEQQCKSGRLERINKAMLLFSLVSCLCCVELYNFAVFCLPSVYSCLIHLWHIPTACLFYLYSFAIEVFAEGQHSSLCWSSGPCGVSSIDTNFCVCVIPNSVQSLSHVRLFETLWTVACQASLSITNSWSLLKLTSMEPVLLSNHLILCRPLLLPPSIFPSIRVFPNESVLHIRYFSY